MKRNRRAAVILLGASAAVLAAMSGRWAGALGIAQGTGLVALGVTFAVLLGVVLRVDRDPPRSSQS